MILITVRTEVGLGNNVHNYLKLNKLIKYSFIRISMFYNSRNVKNNSVLFFVYLYYLPKNIYLGK